MFMRAHMIGLEPVWVLVPPDPHYLHQLVSNMIYSFLACLATFDRLGDLTYLCSVRAESHSNA